MPDNQTAGQTGRKVRRRDALLIDTRSESTKCLQLRFIPDVWLLQVASRRVASVCGSMSECVSVCLCNSLHQHQQIKIKYEKQQKKKRGKQQQCRQAA